MSTGPALSAATMYMKVETPNIAPVRSATAAVRPRRSGATVPNSPRWPAARSRRRRGSDAASCQAVIQTVKVRLSNVAGRLIARIGMTPRMSRQAEAKRTPRRGFSAIGAGHGRSSEAGRPS